MSLFVSSFLPNGNYLIAADTRVSGWREDDTNYVKQDGAHKITVINGHTAMFMSGYYSPARYVAQEYKIRFCPSVAKDLLIQCARSWMSRVKESDVIRAFNQMGEVMVFFLIQFIDGAVKTGLYMSSKNFVPIECGTSPGGVVVLGSSIPGTEDEIRETINSAHTYDEAIRAYCQVYNSQCRAEVGGTLEMYEFSPINGLVKQMKYKIIEKEKEQ